MHSKRQPGFVYPVAGNLFIRVDDGGGDTDKELGEELLTDFEELQVTRPTSISPMFAVS